MNTYILLFNHYLGPSKVDSMTGEGEKSLELVKYLGETKRWDSDKICEGADGSAPDHHRLEGAWVKWH